MCSISKGIGKVQKNGRKGRESRRKSASFMHNGSRVPVEGNAVKKRGTE